MPRIYFPDLAHASKIVSLPPKQAQHVKVLRLNIGDSIELFDAKGLIADAKPCKIDKKSVEIEIIAIKNAKPSEIFPIHLVMSLIRNEQMDWVIQKAVELGVKEITPVMAERSQGRLNAEQAEKRMAHWTEVMVSACEQSGLNFMPTLHPICSLEKLLQSPAKLGELKLILDPYAQNTLKTLQNSATQATLLIGPEGGFTEREINFAHSSGFEGICLHEQILRAETAAITACALVQFQF